MTCPGCGGSIGEGALFCGRCGASLSSACPSCGAANPADHRFCSRCGTGIAAAPASTRATPAGAPPRSGEAGERKQVTVLFTDVVGFTALSERFEPETVREMMDGCFAVLAREVERYGGTVNTFTGDGLMALFGAPVAHEDHAARAVHAAWAIQEAMAAYQETVRETWKAPFELRLGLHTGLVVVGAVGGFKMDFTAMGDTVNLAARVQAAAAPAGILATEATYRAAGGAFAWRPVGPLTLKGKSEPVEAYEVKGLGSARGRFEVLAQRGLTRFVGRDAELGQLVEAWERAVGGAGRVVSVVGEAGLGKSRLLHEFKAHLAAVGASFVEGSCFAYGGITPYLPFLEIVRAAGGSGVPGLDPGDAPFVDALLGHPVDDEGFARLPAAVVRQRTVRAVCRLLMARAAAGPLAVVVEDVHWIDAASQEVLAALVEAMTAAPLLLVLAYRPEYLHAWAAKAQHAEITVGRLGGASSAAMVRAILSKPYAGRVALVPFSAQQSETMLAHLLGTETVSPELEAVVARASRAGMRFYLGSAERLLGEVTGDPAHFERAIAVLAEIGAENELALALAGRGRRLGQHGDPSGARRDLTRALEIFERLGTLEEPERTREELAALGPT